MSVRQRGSQNLDVDFECGESIDPGQQLGCVLDVSEQRMDIFGTSGCVTGRTGVGCVLGACFGETNDN